jgi:hypothetical protein
MFILKLHYPICPSQVFLAHFLFWAWRLMPFFAVVAICLAIWLSFFEPSRASDLIAGPGSGYEDAVVVAYLAGE